MSSNFSPEDIARFQAFLHQLVVTPSPQPTIPPTTVATQPIVQVPSAGPSSSQAPSQSTAIGSSVIQGGIPPITHLYHSSQPLPQGHPAPPPAGQPPAFHPFIGTRLNLPSTAIANQARLASASVSIPRQVSLPHRGRRRTAAQLPPILPRNAKVTIDQCFISDAAVPTIRIVIRVFPALFDKKHGKFLVYQNLRDSVDSWLSQHHLLYRMHLPITTTQIALINSITNAMETSPLQYRFPTPCDNTLAPHESLSLQQLGLSARGAPRANGQIYLRPRPVKSGTVLAELIADRLVYSGKACIEGNEWGLYFAILESEDWGKVTFVRDRFRHTCLGHWFYRKFSGDMAMSSTSISQEDNTSGGELLTASEDEEDMAVDSVDQNRNEVSVLRPVVSEPSFLQGTRFLPAELWVSGWTSPLSDRSHPITLETLAETVYESATEQSQTEDQVLSITGHDVSGLIRALETVITDCISSGDFTQLLLPNRVFQINRSDGSMQTIGHGLERDVIYTAFNGYIRSFTKWFMPRFDNRASLQMSCGFWRAISAGVISEARILDMKKLGAICALMLIHGICPEPLNPLIFQFIIHNGNFNSLHRGLIQEWHPELLVLITRWLAVGPNDSLEPFRSHFAIYHDMDISVLNRNIVARAPEILYYAIFGPEPPFHPEWKAFIQGFSLKCRNGFTFLDIPKAFEGGSEAFLSLLWTSAVTGYDSIRDHIIIPRPPPSYTHALQAATDSTVTLYSLITNFLQGSGSPCPALFAEVCESFSPLVSLDTIDTPAFRSRMLLWAATGSPTIDPNQESLTIAVASDTEPMYADSQNRQIMVAAGKVSFRTCARAARLPGSYILGLAQKSYPSLSVSGEPHTFTDAFGHWFLCEILSAIGGHSML